MNCCFPCCGYKKSQSKREHGSTTPQENNVTAKTPDMKKQRPDEQIQVDTSNINAKNYTFRELATATKNFRQECVVGEVGFGRVYKGVIPSTGEVVAVKQFDRHGMQGSKEFLVEVATLSLLHHENLVNLIGYCADGDQRLLVYEFILGRTLEDHLFDNKGDQAALNWFNRMKVAAGASKGLEYLHDIANPPVIFRDLKASNMLLDPDLNTKLMDFGMARFSGEDKMNHAPPRVMGTYGHCAPECVRTGQYTLKSDVYSFGVVLLELITGRRAIDTTRPNDEQNLVSWAQPLFRDPKRYPDMADPRLNKQFPEKDLNQAVAIAAMCLQDEPEARPFISDVVTALSFLSTVPPEVVVPASLPPATSVSKESCADESQSESGTESESQSESESGSESGSEEEEEAGEESHRRDSTKYQESDVSNVEDDYYKNEKKHGRVQSSRKSSSRSSRNGTVISSGSGDRSVSSSKKSSRKSHDVVGTLNQKSSRKSCVKDLSQKSSKKSPVKDLSQKSSKKTSVNELSQRSSKKSSRKSSVRILSHKSSMESEDGGASLSHNSSSVASEDGRVMYKNSSNGISQGNISFGLTSCSSRRTDEESGHSYEYISSSGSDEGSVHSR